MLSSRKRFDTTKKQKISQICILFIAHVDRKPKIQSTINSLLKQIKFRPNTIDMIC